MSNSSHVLIAKLEKANARISALEAELDTLRSRATETKILKALGSLVNGWWIPARREDAELFDARARIRNILQAPNDGGELE